MELFTVGYEGISLEVFWPLLRGHRIEVLVDVRQMPLSRKPGFSKSALRRSAGDLGIEYQHWPKLGCPRPIRNLYRESHDWALYTSQFLPYLETQADVVMVLARQAQERVCCLLCFEADHQLCHRSFVADAILRQAQSLNLVHLTNRAPVAPVRPPIAPVSWAGRSGR